MKHKLPKLIIASFALLLPLVGSAQPKFAEYAHDLSYFIPKTQQMNGAEVALEGKYNSAIPTPKQVLGFELGQQYCDWGNVLRYMEILDKASDRIQIVELGYTCEYRRMIQLIISSPKNLVNLASQPSRTVPRGPLRCFWMMTSAMFLSSVSSYMEMPEEFSQIHLVFIARAGFCP